MFSDIKHKKVGRNDPCPCGSGLKYKRCHGSGRTDDSLNRDMDILEPTLLSNLPPTIRAQIGAREQKEALRKIQYGEVRAPISFDFQGHKVVAVGNQVTISKKWKTFHDFLFDYLANCVGHEWGNSELRKPLEERHTIVQWYNALCTFQRKHIKNEGEVFSATCTGVVGAYLSLAYDLYVLRHHGYLQKRLVQRLKDPSQFQGARYEAYVASSFIKAGFDIEFEDESDMSQTHCEFNATHRKSDRKYSVEAKSRHRPGFLGNAGEPFQDLNKIRLGIRHLVSSALQKTAKNTRIVFVDINMPPATGPIFERHWFNPMGAILNDVEKKGVGGNLCPPAYMIFTNHPSHYVGEEEIEPSRDLLMTAVNIPTMKPDTLHDATEHDPPVFELWESVKRHYLVPHEFE